MSNHISVRLEMVLVSLQDRCKVYAKHTKAQKSFWTHQMVLLGDKAQVKACFSPFGGSANLDARSAHKLVLVRFGVVRILTQDRCMVCAECTIGSKNIFDATDGTPR